MGQTVTITVSVQEADIILAALSKLPYETSANLINSILEQAKPQLAEAENTQSPAAE